MFYYISLLKSELLFLLYYDSISLRSNTRYKIKTAVDFDATCSVCVLNLAEVDCGEIRVEIQMEIMVL